MFPSLHSPTLSALFFRKVAIGADGCDVSGYSANRDPRSGSSHRRRHRCPSFRDSHRRQGRDPSSSGSSVSTLEVELII